MLQVDPQCLIQYIHWYHESESGVKRLLKTGRNATEPYTHTIDAVLEEDFGRYYCVIKNVVGKTECSAFLAIKSSAARPAAYYAAALMALLASAAVSAAFGAFIP